MYEYSGKYLVRAFVRKPDSPQVSSIASLPNVEIVIGDFDNEETVVSALEGVSRAMLVSSAGQHEMFDRETTFIASAQKAGVEIIVRVSTCSALIHPGTTGVYARAHACIEAFIETTKAPVVDLNPNWFLDNILGNASEAKATGQITYPVVGNGKGAFVDPRDVGSAAAHILLQPKEMLAAFLEQKRIEVHGPSLTSLKEQLEILSSIVGYPIKINTIDGAAWASILQGFGMSKLFATSFLHTVEVVDGVRVPPAPVISKSSALLTATGWEAKYDVSAWCNSDHVIAAFKK